MKEVNDILPKTLTDIDHKGGETVPEGYFDTFRTQMKLSLPDRKWEYDGEPAEGEKRTLWMKVRPYVYMAAMFLGVWCMMNMFDLIRSSHSIDISNSPEMLAALGNDAFVDDYVVSDIDGYDLYDNLYDNGFTPEMFDNTDYTTDNNE